MRPCISQVAADLCHLAAAASAAQLDGPCVCPLQDTLSATLPAFLGVRPDVLRDVQLGALIGRGGQGGCAAWWGCLRGGADCAGAVATCGLLRVGSPLCQRFTSGSLPTFSLRLQAQWVARTEASGRCASAACFAAIASVCARWPVVKLCNQGQPLRAMNISCTGETLNPGSRVAAPACFTIVALAGRAGCCEDR